MGADLGVKNNFIDSEKVQLRPMMASAAAKEKSASDVKHLPNKGGSSDGDHLDSLGLKKDSRINGVLMDIVDEKLKSLINDTSTSRVSYNEKVGLMIVEIVDKATGEVIGTLPEDGFVELRERLIAMNASVGIFLNKRG